MGLLILKVHAMLRVVARINLIRFLMFVRVHYYNRQSILNSVPDMLATMLEHDCAGEYTCLMDILEELGDLAW